MSLIKRQIEIENPELFRGTGENDRLPEDDMNSEGEQEQYWFLVDQEVEKIIAAEGVLTVNGRYFADHKDAQMVRQVEAESRVREAARQREIALRSEMRRAS